MNNRTVWESETPVVPNQVSITDAIYFAWSMPVSVLITGAENPLFLEEKIEMARNFVEMSESERTSFINKPAGVTAEGEVEYYKEV